MNKQQPVTYGMHHLGLTVSELDASAEFFTHVLGWREARRDPTYPAIFVTDGTLMITLWGVKSGTPNPFDREKNIGLHHLALAVESVDVLNLVHKKLEDNGVEIEFSPELLRGGPAMHMMCYEPSGIRVEFIWMPK